MDDTRVWAFEESLWTADYQHYRESIDEACLMVVPAPPFVLAGQAAVDAVADTPRWSSVRFSQQQVARPQEGLIVIAYHVRAERPGHAGYECYATSTYRRLEHELWKVVQHTQMVPPATAAAA